MPFELGRAELEERLHHLDRAVALLHPGRVYRLVFVGSGALVLLLPEGVPLMRPLTFAGFLDAYVRALAGEDTRALPRLVCLAARDPRLVEPLLLWAAATGRAERLATLLAERDDLRSELATLAELQKTGDLEIALAEGALGLRPEFLKVWHGYTVRRDSAARDQRLKLEARQRALALEAAKTVTRYRIAKDLGINPGNLHAFLTQGVSTKLSLERVTALLRYLEAA